MSKKNNPVSKNKWKQLIQKKWFFPALYLTIAALLLTGVVWYQNSDPLPEVQEDFDQLAEELADDMSYDGDVQAVMEQQETIKMPIEDEKSIEVITKFFDYDAAEEDQQQALIEYNNRFYQSTGVDLADIDGESFDIVASLSGTVSKVDEDPLLGNIVVLSHDDDVMTYYASLEDVTVEAGDKVSQGDRIGSAGKNIFGKDNGVHVHFQLRKAGVEVDPEQFFNQPLSKLSSYVMDDSDETEEDEDELEENDELEPEPQPETEE